MTKDNALRMAIEAIEMAAEDAKEWAMQYVTSDNAPVTVRQFVADRAEPVLAKLKAALSDETVKAIDNNALTDCLADYEYLSGLDIGHIAGLKEWLSVRANTLRNLITNHTHPKVTLPKIDYDADMDRYYIPMPAGWEMQTKGKGSSFRLCNTKTHERVHVLDERLQPVLEQMAREMHEASTAVTLPDGWVAVPVEIDTNSFEKLIKSHLKDGDYSGDYVGNMHSLKRMCEAYYEAKIQAAPTLNEKG